MITTFYENKKFRLPDFFIPGAAKSGTTSLYLMLNQHPSIYFPPSRKEPFYFSFGDEKPNYTDEKFNQLPVWQTRQYLELYESADPNQLCGDASTSYLYTAEKSIDLLKEAYGSDYTHIKNIIILRNPIDRAYSHYTYLIRNGHENRSFEDAISEKGILEWKKKRWGFDYLEYGAYYKQVALYKNAFPQTKVWLMEDLKRGNEMTNEVFKFLGLEPVNITKTEKANPSGIPTNRLVMSFLRQNSFVKAVGRSLSPSWQRALKSRRDRLMKKFLERRPLSNDSRLFLRDHYKGDIEKLQTLIDRDLTHWLEDVNVLK